MRRSSGFLARILRLAPALALGSLVLATPARAQQVADVATVAVVGLASGLDVASTLSCRNPELCRESNPLAALFYDPQHPAYLVAADAVALAGVAWLSRTLRRSSSRTARRLWWAPAAVFTLASLAAWHSNASGLRACPECRRAP